MKNRVDKRSAMCYIKNVLKHPDDPREPARKVAERKWRNYELLPFEQLWMLSRWQERCKKPKELEPADVIENDKVKTGTLLRVQTKFAKEIKAMLEGHTHRNTVLYILSLQAKKKRLLVEKLRRLRAAQQAQGESNV
jgi:hypothetical protein